LGQIVVPPNDTRAGANPVRVAVVPATAATDPSTDQQVITQAGPDGALQMVLPWGAARVMAEPVPLFEDMFDTGALDLVDRWSTEGSAPPASVNSVGRLSVSPGAVTASASSALFSKPLFSPEQTVAESLSWVCVFESTNANAGQPLTTGAHRFMGYGTRPTTWTAALVAGTSGPIQDGVGFEIDTDGYLYAVVYGAGAGRGRRPSVVVRASASAAPSVTAPCAASRSCGAVTRSTGTSTT
jgi:hypothetical protein